MEQSLELFERQFARYMRTNTKKVEVGVCHYTGIRGRVMRSPSQYPRAEAFACLIALQSIRGNLTDTRRVPGVRMPFVHISASEVVTNVPFDELPSRLVEQSTDQYVVGLIQNPPTESFIFVVYDDASKMLCNFGMTTVVPGEEPELLLLGAKGTVRRSVVLRLDQYRLTHLYPLYKGYKPRNPKELEVYERELRAIGRLNARWVRTTAPTLTDAEMDALRTMRKMREAETADAA